MHWTRHAWVVATLFLSVACNDRTTTPPIFFEPSDEVDAGRPDVATADADVPQPDGICDDRADGSSCSLPNAAGICVRKRCRLVACLSGFDDCDDETGCETDVRTTEACGGCEIECEEGTACSAGTDGYVCAAGIICPTDRFDIDANPDNGCEWKATWEESWTVVPADLDISALSLDGEQPVLAGISADQRVSTRLGQTPSPTVWQLPDEPAPAVAIVYDDEWIRAVWADGVSALRTADQQRGFVTPDCDAPEGRRQLIAVADDVVASPFELFRFGVDEECVGNVCLETTYTWVDYLADSLPHANAAPVFPFGTDELTSCDTCLFDEDGDLTTLEACAGARQCRGPGFDDTACAGCSAAGCPTLDIVDVVRTEQLFIVITARGFLALDSQDLSLVLRAEEPFDPNTAGGPRYVGAVVDDSGIVTLLHSGGYATSVRLDATAMPPSAAPTHPPVGVADDPSVARVAARLGALVVVADDEVRLVQPDSASARSTYLTLDTAPGVQGIKPIDVVGRTNGFDVFYQAAGQLFRRTLRRPSNDGN